MIQLLGIKEFLPSSAVTKFLGEAVCGAGHIMEETCGNILFLLCGFDTKNLNKTRVPLYLSLYPAGTSVRDVIHFAQVLEFFLEIEGKNKDVNKFDWYKEIMSWYGVFCF